MKKNLLSYTMETDQRFVLGVDALAAHKSMKKIFVKAAEELNELSVKLLKHANNPDKVTSEAIMEEVVDVQMHVILLLQVLPFDLEQQTAQAAHKIEKFINTADYKKFVEKHQNAKKW